MRASSLLLLTVLSGAATAQTIHGSYSAPPAPTVEFEGFGQDVCEVGDLDGDGVRDFAVCASRKYASPPDPNVRVLSGADRRVLLSLDLGPMNIGAAGRLRLASAGDVDGDGVVDLLVGCPQYEEIGFLEDTGAVWIYSLRTGALLRFHESAVDDGFGASLVGMGDVDGDGRDDYAVGAPSGGFLAAGVVYIYSGATGNELYQQYNPLLTGNMGIGLASLGDINLDGNEDLLAGGSSVAVVFTPATETVLRTHTFQDSLGFGYPSFGNTALGMDDIDGDGQTDYLVGAPKADFDDGSDILEGVGMIRAYSGGTGAELWAVYGQPTGPRLLGSDLARITFPGPDRIAAGIEGGVRFLSGADGAGLSSVDPFAGTLPSGSWTTYSTSKLAAFGDVTGDGVTDLVVGNPDAYFPEDYSGSVSVYDGFTFARLELLGARDGQGTGSAVTVLDDVNGDGVADLAVGTPHYDNTSYGGGHVGVISGATGTQLWRTEGGAGAQLGFAVAALSDLDGDGAPELAIGAPREKTGSFFTGFPRTGAVHVRSGRTAALLYTLEGGQAGDRFGSAIAEVGDLNADGTPDFAVGAPGRLGPGSVGELGRVLLYSGATGAALGGWTSGTLNGRAGSTLVALGDVDGNGSADLAVSLPGIGSVRVVEARTGQLVWEELGTTQNEHGAALANVGDRDGDGVSELAVGAPGTNLDTGRVRVHSGATGSVLSELTGAASGERFGASLAGPGDIDADGLPDVAVGAPGALFPVFGWVNGRVTIHSGSGTADALRSWYGSNAGDGFGSALAGGVDFDGDGLEDLLAGSPTGANSLGLSNSLSVRAGLTYPYGSGTPGCQGEQLIVAADSAAVGEVLELRGTNIDPGAYVLMALALGPDLTGTDYGFGFLIHWNLFLQVLVLHGQGDASGHAPFLLPIPDDPALAGLQLYTQLILSNHLAPCAQLPGGFSSSHGLHLVIAP